MGIYTINDDPEADQAVKDILDMVVEGIVDLLGKHIRAIVLIGGYGRGEGGVLKVEGGYKLVNDFDMIVFVDKKFKKIKNKYKEPVEKLAKELQPKTNGLKQIDIDITNTRRFRLVPNKVSYYEIKYGHKVIYGDLNLYDMMPVFKPENLPIFDGTFYFYTRGSGLLIPAIYLIKGQLGNKENQEHFQIELQKACMAIGDALLLMKGQYHFSYQERLKRFQSLININNILPKNLKAKIEYFYEWGVERKLNPLFERQRIDGYDDFVNKWYNVREVFGDFFMWFESERLGIPFRNWMNYSKYISKNGIREPFDIKLREMIKNSINEKKVNLKTKLSRLLPVMPLLLFGLERTDGSCNNKLLDNALPLLDLSKKEEKRWLFAVGVYLSKYHPGGGVEKTIEMIRDQHISEIQKYQNGRNI